MQPILPSSGQEISGASLRPGSESYSHDGRAGRLGRCEAATYQILIAGILPESWAPFLYHLEFFQEDVLEDAPVTWLVGELPDQAALVGVLNRLYDLGFSLLRVECVSLKPVLELQSDTVALRE